MPQDSQQAVEIAVLKQQVEHLEKAREEDKKAQDARIDALEKDRDSALRWGLLILGSSVVSMAAWIFKIFSSKIPV